jgi:carboxyl-terminal processing protease
MRSKDNDIMSTDRIFLGTRWFHGTRRVAALMFGASLAACGGGGGSSESTGVATFAPSATLAALCAVPRTGFDPVTGAAYPDQQGTMLDEQNWLASWTNELYLWYSEVPYGNPASYATAASYFDVLKTPNLTPTGQPKDKFHFTYPTSVWETLSQSDSQPGYGATWVLLSTLPPRSAVVAYTQPGTIATSPAAALSRGAQILQVDGIDLVNDDTEAGVATLNAGLFPATAGEIHQFVVLDLNSATPRTITMTSSDVTSTPVQNVTTLPGGVGYFLFNDHTASAEPQLIDAITQLKTANVSDLVLDMRYNGGGYLEVASELAYMIAGPAATAGKTFELETFNDKNPTTDPVTHLPIAPIPFLQTAGGLSSTPAGTALPHLDLPRVFVLSGPTTCSASESVMNSLRGAGVQVIQIGSTTCGKPYAFYPADNCGTTYFSIQMEGVNNVGFGSYSDGFVPQNGVTAGYAADAIFPGCSVADDFTHSLGDPAETRLATALQYRSGGACPAASGVTQPNLAKALSATDGHVLKSPFLSNRIIRR